VVEGVSQLRDADIEECTAFWSGNHTDAANDASRKTVGHASTDVDSVQRCVSSHTACLRLGVAHHMFEVNTLALKFYKAMG
jgi:hypothetical protein